MTDEAKLVQSPLSHPRPPLQPSWWAIGIMGLMACAAFGGFCMLAWQMTDTFTGRWESVREGMSEAEVLARLGPPSSREELLPFRGQPENLLGRFWGLATTVWNYDKPAMQRRHLIVWRDGHVFLKRTVLHPALP